MSAGGGAVERAGAKEAEHVIAKAVERAGVREAEGVGAREAERAGEDTVNKTVDKTLKRMQRGPSIRTRGSVRTSSITAVPVVT